MNPKDYYRRDMEYINKAKVLLESLPYIKEYSSKIVVVKIGGRMIQDENILRSVLKDIVLMKYVGIKVLLVHGGGNQISEMMKEKGIKPKFVDGLRITDIDTLNIAKMVLIGDINTRIVSLLNEHGDFAMGLSGNDNNFIKCRKKMHDKDGVMVDLGFVGDVDSIDIGFINKIMEDGHIPVIASMGSDGNGNLFNINADTCASDIAVYLKAKKMIMMTDVDGIYIKSGGKKNKVSRMSAKECLEHIESGDISSGMIPKVLACINTIKSGVERAHILNGKTEHSILVEIFTDSGIGTMITR